MLSNQATNKTGSKEKIKEEIDVTLNDWTKQFFLLKRSAAFQAKWERSVIEYLGDSSDQF